MVFKCGEDAPFVSLNVAAALVHRRNAVRTTVQKIFSSSGRVKPANAASIHRWPCFLDEPCTFVDCWQQLFFRKTKQSRDIVQWMWPCKILLQSTKKMEELQASNSSSFSSFDHCKIEATDGWVLLKSLQNSSENYHAFHIQFDSGTKNCAAGNFGDKLSILLRFTS